MKTHVSFLSVVFLQGLLGVTVSASCNTRLSIDGTQNITSPNYPNPYPSNTDCWWSLTPADGTKHVIIEVVYTQIGAPCSYNSLTIYDGYSNAGTRLAQLCGNKTGIYISNSSAIFLEFKSDEFQTTNRGFLVRAYQSSGCGGKLIAGSMGSFIPSPGYPNTEIKYQHCVWTLEAENDNEIVDIEVINSLIDCRSTTSSVTVYYGSDGSFNDEDTLGTFCGGDKPRFQSPGKQLMVVYKTGYSVKSGFLMKYKSVPARDCNRTLTLGANSNLYLISPGYPNNMLSDLECKWTIQSDLKFVPELQFMKTDVEADDNCTDSSITVYENFGSSSALFCGNSTPTFVSQHSIVDVVLRTTDNATGSGFKMSYKQIAPPTPQPTSSPGCGSSNMTASSIQQYLQSPGYPRLYQNNEDCFWTITSTNNSMVRIVVVDSVLERKSDCSFDYVTVYDGSSTSARELGVWCDTTTPTFQSSGRSLTLHFHSDGSNVYKGFRLQYYETTQNYTCGGSLVATSDGNTLLSPGYVYPGHYNNNMDCVWTIGTTLDYISIVVLNDYMERDTTCRYDYVAVYDGVTTRSSILGRFCGASTPTFTTTGRSALIKFHTDSSNTYKGFKLSYFANSYQPTPTSDPRCGPTNITAMSQQQYLQSPGYPVSYSLNEDCYWTITTYSNYYMVRIVTMDSRMETSDSCQYDYVKVLDGPYTYSRELGVWCGNTVPTYQSTGNSMTLHFHSDGSNNFKGFRLQYHQTTSPYTCGGSLTANTMGNTLLSPGYVYPGHYNNSMDCTWVIQTTSTNIKIEVTASDIESSSSCSYDYVNIYDGSTTSSSIGKFCGSQTPTYVSSGDSVTITFHTDNSNTARGFKLTYTGGVFSPCGETDLVAYITTDYITSPNYPLDYPNNADCTWRIDTQDFDYVVSIDVISSSLEYSSGCSYDYVEAFDGYDDSATSLGRWCGTSMPTKHSSGQYMFIKFKTDGSNTDTGFKISYTSEWKDDFPDLNVNVGAIVGGIVGGIFFIILISVFIALRVQRSRPVVTRVPDRQNQGNIYNVVQGPYETTVTPAAFQPPPPYRQVVTGEQSRILGVGQPPPAYVQNGVTNYGFAQTGPQQMQQPNTTFPGQTVAPTASSTQAPAATSGPAAGPGPAGVPASVPGPAGVPASVPGPVAPASAQPPAYPNGNFTNDTAPIVNN